MENQWYALPDLSSTTPTHFQLLEEHLRPNQQRYMSELMNIRRRLNDRLPCMEPWELPGMPPDKEAGKKRRIALTCFVPFTRHQAHRTPHGFWRPRRWGWGIRDESSPSRFAGIKRTYDFHTGCSCCGGTKTNWVMNVYLLVGQDSDNQIQDEVALCHEFENNSPDYDPRPKCAAFHQPPNGEGSLSSTYSCSYQQSGKPCNQAIHGPSSSSSLSTHPVSGQALSTDTGSYDARGGGPDNWERFTKIFAHDPGWMVTLAVCSHCCKILIGDSKNDTSHLHRLNLPLL